MMKIDWCKILGHSYVPIFIKGSYRNKIVEFIGCKCRRCDFGEKELSDAIMKMDIVDYATYSKKYFNNKKQVIQLLYYNAESKKSKRKYSKKRFL